jgi:quercetin dioxygenase-like cupin family protein
MGKLTLLRASLPFCLVIVIGADAQESPDRAKALPYDEMHWQNDKTLPSVQSVPLWGNPASGEHGMLRKFPAGYAPPMHKHPSVERVVVISGTIVVQYGDSGEKLLGPGSYSEVPPNTDHAVKCGPKSECVFLLTSSGPFAIVPSTSNPDPDPHE